jgi:flagellar biosynthesis GTPase FlhF
MIVKSFVGGSAASALKQVREEMGRDAVVLKTREVTEGGVRRVEVTACLDRPSADRASRILATETGVVSTDARKVDAAGDRNAAGRETRVEAAMLSAIHDRMAAIETKLDRLQAVDPFGNQASARHREEVRSLLLRMRDADIPEAYAEELLSSVLERCGDAEQLPEIEKKVGVKANLSVALDNVVERLSELAAGEDLQAFVARVKSYDPDELVAKKDRWEVKKREAQEKQKALVRDVALAEKELESIGGESLAATIAEEAEGLAAEIQADVDHYVKLRLASAVLSKAMERYRQSHQSPVLAAASQYFHQMTDGSFSGLRADFDDKGEPVIKGAKPDGALLGVEEMSDGSRDQLFLSLRLGGLASFVRNNGPMPFIVDDVLVHFDDQRAAAALATMGELGEKTQIIFFTHHRHLVELAKETLPQGILNIHYL